MRGRTGRGDDRWAVGGRGRGGEVVRLGTGDVVAVVEGGVFDQRRDADRTDLKWGHEAADHACLGRLARSIRPPMGIGDLVDERGKDRNFRTLQRDREGGEVFRVAGAAVREPGPAAVREGRTGQGGRVGEERRSEEHTSELQSLMRISYAVLCLKNKN